MWTMSDALTAALRRTRRLRLLMGLAVVVGGMLAAFNAALVISSLALLAAHMLSQPAVVMPLAKAALSTLLAIGAYYLVARPLWRYGRLPDFVRLLERTGGEETYILSACQLGGSRPSSVPGSPVLLDEVGHRALAALDALQLSRTGAMRWCVGQALLAALLISVSLVGNMRYPDAVKGAVMRLLATPRRSVPDRLAHPEPAKANPAVNLVRRPPCSLVTVQVKPPEYLHKEPFALSWNNAVRLAAGSLVEVLCHGPMEGEAITLEARHAGQGTQQLFVPLTGGASDRSVLRALLPLAAETEVFVTGADGRTQPGKIRLLPQADAPPQVRLLQPEGTITLDETDSLAVLVDASDDHGLSAMIISYQVEGLDAIPATIELARPADQRQAVVQRDLPLTSFGADPGDRLVFHVEARDGNDVSGPGKGRSATCVVEVHSRFSVQKEVVEALAAARNQAVDLVAAGLLLEVDGAPEKVLSFREGFEAYVETLDALSGQMGQSNLFKEEDSRRLATLAAAGEELLPTDEASPAELSRWTASALREMEQQVYVIDGLVEKLMGEYLFHHATRVQRELERVVALAREGTQGADNRRGVKRSMRRLQRAARRAVEFSRTTRPSMPALFTSAHTRQETDWFAQVASLAGQIASAEETGAAGDWREDVERLSRAVERAVRSVEGAYAQSMTRLSSSFRNAQDELSRRLTKALELNLAFRADLEALLKEVAQETRKFIRRGKTIEQARSVARTARNLSRKARRFRAATYLKVDRNQVVEFRSKLGRLTEAVGILKIDEATGLAEDLVALTNSMEFSLKLSIRYSKDQEQVRYSKRELDKVEEARKLAETVLARLSLIRPQRQKLKSLRSENLEAVIGRMDKLSQELVAVRGKVEGLNKLFPIFFGKFGPLLDRTIDSSVQARTRLGELMLEDALRQALFMEENLARLLDSLENASRNARTASALSAGGSQPAQELAGKEQVVSRERLEQYLRLSASLGDNDAWQEIVGSYFQQLSP
jgi:hypothetical protein